MELEVWQVLDRIVQWAIIPVAALMWNLLQSTSRHEREILRILTLLEERKEQRTEDREELADAMKRLHDTLEKLNDKIDNLRRPHHE